MTNTRMRVAAFGAGVLMVALPMAAGRAGAVEIHPSTRMHKPVVVQPVPATTPAPAWPTDMPVRRPV